MCIKDDWPRTPDTVASQVVNAAQRFAFTCPTSTHSPTLAEHLPCGRALRRVLEMQTEQDLANREERTAGQPMAAAVLSGRRRSGSFRRKRNLPSKQGPTRGVELVGEGD